MSEVLTYLKSLVAIMLLLALTHFGFKTYQNAKLYEATTITIAQQSNASTLAQGKIDRLTSAISFGLIKNKTQEQRSMLNKKQKEYKEISEKQFYYFIYTLVAITVFSILCTLAHQTLILALSSFISLIYGLVNPILMVTIHKNVDHLGDVILSFESKGILGSISKLFDTGENMVALTILLFSVIIPLLKIFTLIFVIVAKEFNFAHTIVKFFKILGKWSMIDVFVVAVFLVYFTSNQGDVTHAEIEVGLYFFLIYVLLSMVAAILTHKVLIKSPSLQQSDQKKP
ncbi:MAG TPA: paraquat-inducible protein A [Campylobacterales bacterium]|nr:paraquat-inducible protein A [Campylobacterales bacterium]